MGWGVDREQSLDQDQGQDQNQHQGQRAGAPAPHRCGGFVPWIQAVAEDSDGDREKRNPKRMGEMSQAAFLVKAQRLGFALAVPWGDSEKCDFIVWERECGRLLRVQVKATGRLHGGGYDVQPVYATREGKKTYTAAEIDVLAAHVAREGRGELGVGDAGGDGLCQDERGEGELRGDDFREGDLGKDGRGKGDREAGEFRQNDVWYLLPVRAIAGVKSLRLFPDLRSRRPRWERYREAWEWMRGKK
jgi:hypothetical protein